MILLTPGPLTTSPETKEAQVRDWGSRDGAFIEMTASVIRQLNDIVHGGDDHVSVLIQGSGTFVVEAALGTLIPRDGHALICVNGEYGKRIARICGIIGRRHKVLQAAENEAISPARVDEALAADPSLGHVVLVHCETTAGTLNPVDDIAAVVAKRGRGFIIDAMSSFGAVDIDARRVRFDAVVAASGKCLEGVPGMGFAIMRREALERCKDNCHSLSLDLYDQWQAYGKTKQWRFTPPTTVVAALAEALRQFNEEGGVAGRGARYRANCERLVSGMEALGFVSYLPRAIQAPIITTWFAPGDRRYEFTRFYDEVQARGFALYPGKLTQVDTFRVGCIGAIGEDEIRRAVATIGDVARELGITELGPRRDAALARA